MVAHLGMLGRQAVRARPLPFKTFVLVCLATFLGRSQISIGTRCAGVGACVNGTLMHDLTASLPKIVEHIPDASYCF
jgi:hypothetical protein